MFINENFSMPVIPCEPDFNFFDGEGGRYIVESNTLSYCKADSEKDIEEFKSKFQDGKCVKPNIQTNGLDGKQITHICLQATHECQLRCDYCFVDNYYSGGMCGRMKFETAKKFIDQYLSGEHVSVGFFGGEPLLNMELIVGVVDYCKQKFKNCSFHVTTNGILLNHKDKFVPDGLTNVEYFDQNGFTMIVSLDGSKDAHDIHRKFAGGKSCFDNVIEGVDSLKGKKVAKVNTLRGTFTSELFDSPITLKDRLEFLNKKMYEGCSANISLEPAVLSENSCISKGLDLSFTGENDEDKLMALYYDAIRWYIKELREGRHPTWFQIDLMTTRILYGIHMFSECGAGLGYMSCSWDGRISACHREGETYIGDLKYGIDEQERSKWSENRIYGRYSCMKCPMRYYCGGGCRECSLLVHKDIHIPFKQECLFRRLWIRCAFYLISEIGEEELKKHLPNKRHPKQQENSIPNMDAHRPEDIAKQEKDCGCKDKEVLNINGKEIEEILEKLKRGNHLVVFSDDNTNKALINSLQDDVNGNYLKFNLSVVYVKDDMIKFLMRNFMFDCGTRSIIFMKDNSPQVFWGLDSNLSDNEIKEIFGNVINAKAVFDNIEKGNKDVALV